MPDISNLYAGYTRASRYTRVPQTTLTRALKPYNLTLAQLRGQSDSQLRSLAAKSVIEKYRKAISG